MVVKIAGKRMWLWRAADDEGEVMDMLVQKRRNTVAAPRLMRKLPKHYGTHPETIVMNKLASCSGSLVAAIVIDQSRH